MMRLPRPVSSLALVLSSVLALALVQGETAEAGHAHFSGSVRIGGGAHFRGGGVSVHFARPVGRPFFGRPRVWVGGGWWHNWYWPRPYYYYYYYPYPESVPSYYGGNYYPVQPSVAAPGSVPMARRERPMPALGVGVFAGGTNVNGMKDSSELGVLARLRLTDGLLIEAEVAKDTFNGAVSGCPSGNVCTLAANGDRIDRRIGGSLIWEIGARNMLAPYLLAGGGVQQAKVSGTDFVGADFSTTQEFGEVGVGLRLALSRNLHLTLDVRAGRRKTIDSSNQDAVPLARTINPPSGGPNNDTEDYTRGRLAAILNF
jgi:hypothetical protein